MNKNYLLTYLKANSHQYEWFETEEEMLEFVDTHDSIEVLDSLELFNVREIDIEKSSNSMNTEGIK